MKFRILECDVLVIGAGGAGLRAAIAANDNKTNVIVISKSLLGKSHTVMAEGGINASLANVDREDNWKIHFKDTMTEGRFLSDYKLVEILVKEAPDRILEMEHWGAVFDRTKDGKIDQRFFGAHTYRRACHTGDRIGLEIIRTLEDQVRCKNIKVMEEIVVTKLLTSDNSVYGATAVDIRTGEFITFNCKSVIMTTGGCGRVYKISTNSLEAVGDGYSLALQAGAELQDMEMIQFHPTCMVYPENVRGMLVTEAVRGEGGILLNSKNERFMEKYDPKRKELSARDIVARAIYREIEEGRGTKNGGVWLDITHLGGDYIMKKIPRMHDQFITYAGIDIIKEKMEVAPSAHYTMGGIRINTNCSAGVEGLFAAGECAGGIHGANRLGGNSLADILVFGKIAGDNASKYAKRIKLKKIDETIVKKEYETITSFFKQGKGLSSYHLKNKLQEIMWSHVGIIMDNGRLENSLEEIRELKKLVNEISVKGTLKYNPDWLAAMDIINMITVCECIVKSAYFRRESRGAHYREDYPEENKKWLKNIMCSMKRNKIELAKTDVPKPRDELLKILGEER